MSTAPSLRLRQVVLVTRDLVAARASVEDGLGLRTPYADPGVGEFGLTNAVYEAGFDFVEIVSPQQQGTTAGRYLDRNGDGGYMAIFQVAGFDELGEVRQRLSGLGIRTVWQVDLPDIASSHLHPKDVPGAIVSVDAAEPAESWRWGGPRWTESAPAQPFFAGGILAVTIAVESATTVADRWASVLGCQLDRLPSGQSVRFVEGTGGIIEIELDLGRDGNAALGTATIHAT